MAGMQTFLEQDKERFLQIGASAQQPQDVIRLCEDELSRVLSMFNEQENSDEIKEAALHMIQSVRMSLPLMNSDGTSKIYSKTEYGTKQVKAKKSAWYWIWLLLGLLSCIAAAVILVLFASTLLKSMQTMIGLGVAVLAMFLFYLAGRTSRPSTAIKKDDLYAETQIDTAKVYHTILSAVVAIDKNIEDMKRQQLMIQKKKLLNNEDVLDKAQIDLLAGLLETSYAESDNSYAKEVITDIRFYLHKMNIDVVDYSEERKTWFDQMPAPRKATIRPALAVENTLIKKGLASGGN